MPKGEICPRETWRAAIRPAIKKWLQEHDPQQKIRCLVTVWGVPLKITPATPDDESRRYKQFLEAERAHRLELLAEVVSQFNKLAPDDSTKEESPGAAESKDAKQAKETGAAEKSAKSPQTEAGPAKPITPASSDVAKLQTGLEAALQRAQARLSKLQEGNDRTHGQAELQKLATAAGGLNILLPALNQRIAAGGAQKDEIKGEFDALRGRLMSYLDCKSLLDQMPMAIDRDVLALAILERTNGLLGAVQWLDQQLDIVNKNESGASFDSELSLVMWPDDYQLMRWQPNYLRPGYNHSQLPKFFRTLMVSRIDAPTLVIAKGLIDTAVEVEKKGLHGKFYIDARGLTKPEGGNYPPGSYEDFDRSLLAVAKGVQEQTDIKVVLENTPQLFLSGQCPDAALYCGWYSLAKYIPAFDWVPGAVAYHLASAEAATLRDPGSEVWCKKMLENGVCATIGPVYEPYLAAFPRPDEFFALLLAGDKSLVECYYLTQPFNSWMMTLIGDPLYRPFKYRAENATSGKTNPAAATTPAAKDS
jgi:uncharacterized protein (TIGR03790 family)